MKEKEIPMTTEIQSEGFLAHFFAAMPLLSPRFPLTLSLSLSPQINHPVADKTTMLPNNNIYDCIQGNCYLPIGGFCSITSHQRVFAEMYQQWLQQFKAVY